VGKGDKEGVRVTVEVMPAGQEVGNAWGVLVVEVAVHVDQKLGDKWRVAVAVEVAVHEGQKVGEK